MADLTEQQKKDLLFDLHKQAIELGTQRKALNQSYQDNLAELNAKSSDLQRQMQALLI